MRGDRDANVMFSTCDGCAGLRVLLGGWGNQKSFIRDKEHDESKQTLVDVRFIPDFMEGCFSRGGRGGSAESIEVL